MHEYFVENLTQMRNDRVSLVQKVSFDEKQMTERIPIIRYYLFDCILFISFYTFFLAYCGCDTSYIVSVHIQCQASIYTLLLCRGHSWRVRLAKQETLTPPGHLVSPLVCRGPWMSTVVLYCWCHSDSASVLLYFTQIQIMHILHKLFNFVLNMTSIWREH